MNVVGVDGVDVGVVSGSMGGGGVEEVNFRDLRVLGVPLGVLLLLLLV